MFLTDEELVELTKKQRRKSQQQVLNALGIVYKVRPDGSLVVARDHALRVFGAVDSKKKPKEVEPNWGALANA